MPVVRMLGAEIMADEELERNLRLLRPWWEKIVAPLPSGMTQVALVAEEMTEPETAMRIDPEGPNETRLELCSCEACKTSIVRLQV